MTLNRDVTNGELVLNFRHAAGRLNESDYHCNCLSQTHGHAKMQQYLVSNLRKGSFT